MDGSDKALTGSGGPPRAPQVRFLREDGPVEDEFGAHGDIGRAIADSLAANPDLRVVGILGRWGSGKSTVVSLAEEYCRPLDIAFFTYDAWLHQSDAPRRAFIEELMRFVKHEGADLGQIESDWDFLVGRKERVETSSTPGVPIWAGFVLAVGLAAPLALNFVRPDWRNWLELGWLIVGDDRIGLPFVWGALIALAPVALLFGASLVGALRWIFGHRGPNAGVVSVFANRLSEVRTDVKTRQPDPTTLEFQRFLKRILGARAEKRRDRLVLVVDNLDRLPDDEMLTLWSTIRGLFHGAPSVEQAMTLPTVLLPVDAAAILRVHNDNEEIAVGFEEKTFDIVFRVPTPVHSAWKRYLRTRLLKVFGPEVEAETTVGQLWAAQAGRILEEVGQEAKTPRSLNVFVNQVAVLWLQWRERQISFAAMCFYAAHARKLETDPVKVLQVDRPWMTTFDPDWASAVAAIRFGTSPEVAIQTLLKPALHSALAANDQANFVRLSHIEGFSRVVREVSDEIAYSQSRAMTPLILFLDEFEPAMKPDMDLSLAWRNMIAVAIGSTDNAPIDEATTRAFSVLLRQSSDAELRQLIRSVPNKLQHLPEENLRLALPWFALGLEACRAAAPTEERVPVATLPLGLTGVLALCDAGVPPAHLAFFAPGSSPAALARTISEQIANGEIPTETLKGRLTALALWPHILDWDVLVNELGASLDNSDSPTRTLPALALIRQLASNTAPAIVEILKTSRFSQLVTSGLPSILTPAGSFSDGLPLALALLLAEGLPLPVHNNLDRPLADVEGLPEQVVSALADFAPEFTLHDLAQRPEDDAAFSAKLFARLVGARRLDIDPVDVARNPTQYARLAGDNHHLLAEATRAPEFWSIVSRAEDVLTTLSALEEAILAGLPSDRELQADQIARSLLSSKRVSQQLWEDALLNGGGLISQYQRYAGSSELTESDRLESALQNLAARLANSPEKLFVDRWFSVADLQSPSARQKLYALAASELLASQNPVPLFTLFRGGLNLLSAQPFEQFSELFLTKVIMGALEDPTAIGWLHLYRNTLAPLIARAPADARSLFVRRLLRASRDAALSEGLRQAASELVELIGPEPRTP